MKPMTTLLVANRGEIAVRVMRTAKALGLRTVAVYSEADRDALHVRSADTAVCIGPAPVADSYLQIPAIIDAAQRTGADAVHPGYGFLSENAEFSKACHAAGLIFVGPSEKAIDVMGDKARSKRAMIEAGVPCIPGYQGDEQSLARLSEEAKSIGMPVMVKAAAGGGGRGMRLVHEESQLSSAIELAQSEALNAFGSDVLIIEKALVQPRHVEVQVFADQVGNTVYLGERDCSIQRRHQKVVEESPCPVMTPELRARMGEAAVAAARSVDYVGAGTVEFLLDNNGDFYFLEMNTRLQVEHPVTELVTGYDLVEWQLRVARGESLPASQQDIELFGHAIEVRLYAEDPAAGFLPSTGPVHLFTVPERRGVRVDAGVESGDAVSPFYDAMVAKIMAWGETREDARVRLIAALQESALHGFANNRDFLIDTLERPVFIEGAATTSFIADHYGDRFSPPAIGTEFLAAGAAIQQQLSRSTAQSESLGISAELLDWTSMAALAVSRSYHCKDLGNGQSNDAEYDVQLVAQGDGDYRIRVGETTVTVRCLAIQESKALLEMDGHRFAYRFFPESSATLHLSDSRQSVVLTDANQLPPESEDAAGAGVIVAPMHGQLLSIEVVVGEAVVKGQRLAVLEAMKMQHEILADVDGIVSECIEGADRQMAAGDLILKIQSERETDAAGE